ncbi:hypothetical protein UPYG_G00253030 [Umbra pygmaea]|uniref:Adhesion G-protein coupled receptor F3-like n=1 Tax=Umbra pygmaea TaxID=75934 RepID=A0ABD0W7W7_UMBPY
MRTSRGDPDRGAIAVDTYMAEFIVEGNATLDISDALSVIAQIGELGNMTIEQLILTAECEITGNSSTCNCTPNYTWSNLVCDQFLCCNDSSCNANLSNIPAFCIPKENVSLNGTVVGNKPFNDMNTIQQQLQGGFNKLNGFISLMVTGPCGSVEGQVCFEMEISVKCTTDTLAKIITSLEVAIGNSAEISIQTSGIVHIQYPKDTVYYSSMPMLTCTINHETDGAWSWWLIQANNSNALNTGTSVTVTAPVDSNCTNFVINKLSGIWAGVYMCKFVNGNITHTASGQLKIALLPDTITMTNIPLSVQCGYDVTVSATIQNSTETYSVTWLINNQVTNLPTTTSVADGNIIYNFQTPIIPCQPETPNMITVNFMNQMNETKNATIVIPVLYGMDGGCFPDTIWPATPNGFTLFNRTCEVGRVGYIERTCIGPQWMDELDQCVNEKLNQMFNAAANFKEGFGATSAVALQIFTGLKNITNDKSYSAADLSASIDILDIMSQASAKITLDDSVLGEFLTAASNMLSKKWDQVNTTIMYSMSSSYLKSVEGLVKNIYINNTDGNENTNLEFKLCQNVTSCNQTVFGVDVKLNQSSGTVKTLGVKNLADKLNNSHFQSAVFPSIVVSATLQNHCDSTTNIELDFPLNQSVAKGYAISCVFWNTTLNEWSVDGCKWKELANNKSYCNCNHLTSFSMLMSKVPVNLPFLDEITYVGLGVSICSLLVFIVIEALVWSAVVKSNLSHFRHTALVNIALCLLMADCSFLASSFPSILSPTLCLVLTLAKHFFFQAMFCWMLCLSIMLMHQLIFVFHPLRKRVYMFFSTILGYICPTVIVGVTYLYYKYTKNEYYDSNSCWLKYVGPMEGSIHAFLLPVGTIVFMNFFSMCVVILTLLKSSLPEESKADEKETAKSIMKVVIFLTPVFGVTWGLGFFVLMFPNEPIGPFMNYAFTIINSLQGLFILLTGCFAEKRVRDEVLKIILAGMPPPKERSESTKNLTSKSTPKN